MFDPTVYDNLKVVLEGALYDLDLGGKIAVTGRADNVELASMSRSFRMSFTLASSGGVQCDISLHAELADFAAELIGHGRKKPGTRLYVTFHAAGFQPVKDSETIKIAIREVWGERPEIKQTVSYDPDMADGLFDLIASLHFGRKLDESQIDDIPELIEHAIRTVSKLDESFKRSS